MKLNGCSHKKEGLGGWCTLFNGLQYTLYGEAPPKGAPFSGFRYRYMKG